MIRSQCTPVAAFAAALAFAAGAVRAEDKLPDAARTALEKADQIDVMSLDPAGDEKGKDAFHDYKVLSKTTVKDGDARKEITTALEKGVAEGGPIAKCFEPRHGLHVVYQDKTYDFLICYQCSQIQVFSGTAEPATVATSSASKAALDKALKNAGTPK
ncbi:MAG TPA: hypothetical protein VMS17_05710 [Gemmataceae bacterium]|nr:hypothetical protein [Gemmataceae bacterium]